MTPARKRKSKTSSRLSNLSLELKVTLAADPCVIDSVVQSVMKTVHSLHCFRGKDDAVELALTEALANAVVHGANRPFENRRVRCSLRSCKKGSSSWCAYPGTGFALDQVPDPLPGGEYFFQPRTGIYLINRLMDEVQFLKNGWEFAW